MLVSYDGTPEGEDALALGRLLAQPLGAELIAACVKPLALEAERALAGAAGGRFLLGGSGPVRAG